MPFIDNILEDFIGSGVTYPIELDSRGCVSISTGFKLIESSIKICTAWPLGQRFFLAEFGSQITRILEEPNDTILKHLLSTFFKDAVEKWEKRVEEVIVTFQDLSYTKITVKVDYRVINTPRTETFIFPFYRNITT